MGSHYVPQQYLRGFQAPEEPGAIWCYDKKTARFRRVPIKVVAQETGYYDEGVERELSERVEGPAHAVLAKIRRREEISSSEREQFALYATSMMLRGPRRRRAAFDLMPEVLADVTDGVRAAIADWASRP